jgi:hypothetical protein
MRSLPLVSSQSRRQASIGTARRVNHGPVTIAYTAAASPVPRSPMTMRMIPTGIEGGSSPRLTAQPAAGVAEHYVEASRGTPNREGPIYKGEVGLGSEFWQTEVTQIADFTALITVDICLRQDQHPRSFLRYIAVS